MMKRFTLILALILTLTSALALADTTIAVSGTGETQVSADTAIISLGVNTQSKEVLEAQQTVNTNIAAVRKALLDNGVSEENINTDYLNIYAIYDYTDNREQVVAYNANSTLAVKVTDMDKVGALIDAAFAAGANTLNGITFSASDTESAQAEALRLAVADAKAKAEVLAEAAGLKIVGIERISDSNVFSYSNDIGNFTARSMDTAGSGKEGTVVQAAKMIVSGSVNITYKVE
ncbi:MAG: SIMPL domain-containing protein [Clostridia bacterium]|nr:SIMPL domain-containing protein [Clostridia bacterium]